MNDLGVSDLPPGLESLARALCAWVRQGNSASLERWFARELEADGAPIRLSIPDWWQCVRGLAEARHLRPGWSKKVDRHVLALLRSLLRFSRPGGTPTTDFDAVELDASSRTSLAQLARAYARTGEARVIGCWLSLPDALHVPPPLPAWSSSRHVLAVLRGGWQKGDDLFVVDHRRREPQTRFELMGSGSSWLGPDWRLARSVAASSCPRPGSWISSSAADLLEWSYRSSGLRLRRTALLLRGRKMALLGDQIGGKDLPGRLLETEFGLPAGVTAEPIPGCRGLLLRTASSRATAQVLPVALPAAPHETDRGQLCVLDDHRHLTLSCMARGGRCWLPLLVSWDPRRHRKQLSWRVLTVAQDSKVCAQDVAFAVRVSWGRDDTLVIYRSLGPPAPRSFLGHQTKARFLLGRFTSEGNVEPLLSVD
ncbi:MAG: hypothetical protein ABSH35_01785 [Isosphaeraceae bacterium]|jgi:hypothetical protein